MNRATLLLTAALTLVLPACSMPASRTLHPLNLGWEQQLSLTWEAGERRGHLIVSGYVNNTSPYDLTNVRLLVEALDEAGQVVDQRVGWALGELRGSGRLYFEVPIAPAPRYRVRVFSYDRLESAGLMSLLR